MLQFLRHHLLHLLWTIKIQDPKAHLVSFVEIIDILDPNVQLEMPFA
jgi:hypothetical protein